MGNPRTIIIAAVLAFSVGSCSIVMGQSIGNPGTRKRQPKPPPTTPKPTVTIVTRTIREKVTPTTGSLSVAAEPGTTILVEPLNIKKGQRQQGTMPKGDKVFIFNDLKPDRYRVAGSLAGYKSEEKIIRIQANKSHPLTLDFQLIRYPVTINTNIDTGDLKYGLEGQPLNSVVAITNRTVQLDLPSGRYEVEITPREFGFESRREAFSVDSEQIREIKLDRIVLTTLTLSPSWTSAEVKGWDMPSSWQADSKKRLLIKGAGIALPPEPFRRYKDFHHESTVKLNNKSAISFVLRARDKRNYYLLQLTSENSDEPYRVRLFVVKDGVERRIQAIPIPQSRAMGSGFFPVSIRMIDYEITVEITDSQGVPYPLGRLTDPDHNFAVGAVGIAVRDNEENLIERFVVCTIGPQCLNE